MAERFSAAKFILREWESGRVEKGLTMGRIMGSSKRQWVAVDFNG
jgi:hypothetical protein